MSENLTTVPSLTEDDYIRCLRCGSEAQTEQELEHNPDCPV